MKIKLLVALLASSLWCGWAEAQIGDITNPLNGRITVVDAGTCSTANSFVIQQLPQNANTTTVNLSGTFTATLTARLSNNGGTTWTTGGAVAAGTTSFSTNGFTHICVDSTAFTSGTVLVTITTGLLQVQSVVSSASSSGAANAAPNMGFYFTPQCQVGQLNCVSTFADTLENNTCSWTNASTTVTCLTEAMSVTAAVLTLNVATYTGVFPSTWAAGNSITVVSYGGGDAFYNQTCTITTVNATTITCPITHATSASTGNPGTVINNSVGPFTSADVGKTVKGGQTCATDQSTIGGQISTTVDVTILSFISSTQVTLSATPSQTATLSTAFAQGACLVYGHLDDAAAVTLDALLMAAPTCPKLFMAAANYFFSKPHFFNNPQACNNIGPGIGMPYNFGGTALTAGFEIEGRGTGPTAWFLTASFPNGDPCTHKPTTSETSISGTGGGCFVIPVLGKWDAFRIDGGVQSGRGNLPAAGASLIYMSFGTLMNFTCTNMGYLDSAAPQIGIELGAVDQLYQVNNAGCGAVNIWQNATSGGGSQLTRVVAENASVASLRASGVVNVDFSFLLGGALITSAGVIQNFGSTVRLHYTFVEPAAGGLNTGDTVFGYQCKTSGCILSADDSRFLFFDTGGASLVNGSIQCSAAISCNNFLRNTTLSSQSGGATYNDGTSGNSVLYDQGGNTLVTTRFLTSGSIIADGRSLLGMCTGVANASVTNSLYNTGPNVTATTCAGQTATLGTGVVMTQNRTLSDLHCSSSATTVSVACTVMVNGAASTITCTMTAATSCTDELGGHTVAVVKGDLISMRIVTGAAETGANIKAFVLWQ